MQNCDSGQLLKYASLGLSCVLRVGSPSRDAGALLKSAQRKRPKKSSRCVCSVKKKKSVTFDTQKILFSAQYPPSPNIGGGGPLTHRPLAPPSVLHQGVVAVGHTTPSGSTAILARVFETSPWDIHNIKGNMYWQIPLLCHSYYSCIHIQIYGICPLMYLQGAGSPVGFGTEVGTPPPISRTGNTEKHVLEVNWMGISGYLPLQRAREG